MSMEEVLVRITLDLEKLNHDNNDFPSLDSSCRQWGWTRFRHKRMPKDRSSVIYNLEFPASIRVKTTSITISDALCHFYMMLVSIWWLVFHQRTSNVDGARRIMVRNPSWSTCLCPYWRLLFALVLTVSKSARVQYVIDGEKARLKKRLIFLWTVKIYFSPDFTDSDSDGRDEIEEIQTETHKGEYPGTCLFTTGNCHYRDRFIKMGTTTRSLVGCISSTQDPRSLPFSFCRQRRRRVLTWSDSHLIK